MAIAQRCLYSMSSGARTHWTLPAVIVLWTSLWGIASSYPIPSRTNATFLEKKWETLFSRSYLGINGGKSELNWESDYLQGIKRVRRLYCNVGIGFHLQVLPDGRISGAHNENQYSLIEISTVDRGVISLFGVRSELFVAMNSRGRLYGTSAYLTLLYEWSGKKQEAGICIRKGHFFCNNMPPPPISLKACFVGRLSAKVKRVFVDECKFKETLLPNNYNAYESFVYKGFYIALSKHGRVKRGNKATTAMTVTHFLPRL